MIVSDAVLDLLTTLDHAAVATGDIVNAGCIGQAHRSLGSCLCESQVQMFRIAVRQSVCRLDQWAEWIALQQTCAVRALLPTKFRNATLTQLKAFEQLLNRT